MTEPCTDLVSFVDGELEPARADAFRAHLTSCATCRADLIDAIQLNARLNTLSPPVPRAPHAPLALVAEDASAGPPEDPPPAEAVAAQGPVARAAPAAPIRAESPGLRVAPPAPRRPRWKPWAGATAGALAIAAVVCVLPFINSPPVESAVDQPNPFAYVMTTPVEVRFAYGPAARYRPVHGPMRGEPRMNPEELPPVAVAALEARGDQHGAALAGVWNGTTLENVAARLDKLEPTPSIQSDRIAILSTTTSQENLEPVLAKLEQLQRDPDVLVARAAQWNYALTLSTLKLSRSAAAAFAAIADQHEAGWSDDARVRSGWAEASARDTTTSWYLARDEGNRLLATGAPVSAASLRAVPGLMRAYLYNAVRSAPTRARVSALADMAAELDGAGDTPILGDYVQRVARVDFARRAPLARAYARLLHGQPVSAAELRALTTSTPAGEVDDIVMGALIERDAVATHAEAFRKLVERTRDPWFEVVLAKEQAKAEVARGQWLAAEARLRTAAKRCGSLAIAYQCLDLALELGRIYEQLHRVPDALAVLRAAVGTARSTGELGYYRQLLWQLADVERFNSSTATARAYANEVVRMPDGTSCRERSAAYRVIASAALIDRDGPAARRALDEAVTCQGASLTAASDFAYIGRLDPRPGDLAQLRGWLRTLRASNTLSPAQQILADEAEGRLLIESERAPGVALIEGAIASADRLPDDVFARKARASAYSTLIADAARHGDHARAMALFTQDLGLPAPSRCAVGMTAEDERAVVVVRGLDGQARGTYEARRERRAGALTIADELARSLAGCAHVQVMARAALEGQPRVLPDALPWSYATGAHRGVPRSVAPAIEPRILIITDVAPPAELKLAPLSAEHPAAAPSVHVLSGPGATPTRVLAELGDATEIQFHTHALLDVGMSDASHLVLSPDPDGHYALTAEAVRGRELRGHPIVVLAACQSAQGAHYQHAPWSLPEAFVAAGARAVFAAGTDIPDHEAGPFFDRVLAHVRGGADPATALRDERIEILKARPSSWVANIVLFE